MCVVGAMLAVDIPFAVVEGVLDMSSVLAASSFGTGGVSFESDSALSEFVEETGSFEISGAIVASHCGGESV